MRYRRGLQRIRISKMDFKNKRIHVHKNLKHKVPNITIKDLKGLYVEQGILNPTFSWERELCNIRFYTKCRVFKEVSVTKVIPLKYEEGMPKWVSVYPHDRN